MAFAGSAAAQSTPQEPTEVDEVVVTGIRSAIESSIATKRNETSIVEVVTAEDIGKLPDVSIAESLGRLPGLSLQRLDGRGQNISIRGLGPDFTTALLNGREQVTTSDNRGVEFDQYPSELLGSVVVYKTPDSALIGQGLAGTVDLRVIRPLEYGRRAVAANLRYEVNDIGALNAGTDDSGWRYSVSYIDQFADDTVGVVLGYAHIESPYQSERFNAWGYPEVTGGGPRVIGGSKPYVMSANLERNGYIGVLELKPNDRVHMTFDAFYSEFDNTQILRGIELPLFWSSAQLQPGYTVEDGLVVARDGDGFGHAGAGLTRRETVRALVGVLRLDAEVAGQGERAHHRVDVELDEGRGDLLLDHPVARAHVGVRVADHVVEAALHQAQGVVADHPGNAEIGQRGRVEAELRRHDGRGAAGHAEVELVVDQFLLALRSIDADLDAADEGPVHIAFDREAGAVQFVIDRRRVQIAVLAAGDDVAAPALRAGQADQVEVAVVQTGREAGDVLAGVEADRVGRPDGTAAGAGVGFQDLVGALDAGVVDVGVQRPGLVELELAVPSQRGH
ncbi:MAG TPA: TonB-dependent receptor plug domain-containing protein, partial [Brevundimonas sp.]|nr:TonB-dependent receptor plug domain-containing protein [Brevundimonas sp.]